METDSWQLVLTAVAAGAALIAALTGVWLIVWGWFDRPHTGWTVHISRPRWRRVYRDGREETERIDHHADRHKATVTIKPTGTAKAYDVHVWFSGCTVWDGHDDLYAPRIEVGSDPLVFEVMLRDANEGVAYAYVTWKQLRPRRQHGQRWDLRAIERAEWQWRWRSLRWRDRRLVRKQGEWVLPKSRPVPEIPIPDGATGPLLEPKRPT